MNTYGHFNESGTEYHTTNPSTPRAFDNFLWNDAIFSNVWQTGVGYCDYQYEDTEAIQLLTGNGRICDFDVFGRESLMSRLIYVRDNDTGVFWNVNWEPVCHPYESYECVHGLGYTALETTVNGVKSTFSIFVPTGRDTAELWKLTTANPTNKTRNLSIFVYNQFQLRYKWGFDSYGDMLFRSSNFDKERNAIVVCKHPHIRPHNYLTGYLAADKPIVAFDGTRDAFLGMYGSLNKPSAVINGRCTNTPGSSDATVAVAQFDIILTAGESQSIQLILGATDNVCNIEVMKNKYFGQYDKYLDELKDEKQKLFSAHIVKTEDEYFNYMFNYWMKEQSLFGAAWCRWGWNGYRDIVQHGFGVASIQPERTKEILRAALSYQYEDGLAVRGWNPVDTKPYSDSALWLCFALVAYVQETGDTEFLDEIIPYYDKGQDSVLGHVEKALYFLETHKGSHGLCLIRFGDWNDSLTAVGKAGKGESVWLSEAYGYALISISGLYEYLSEKEKQSSALAKYEMIKAAINDTAWDGEWYVRCFDDNGEKVGSNENEAGRIFIESQAWALIAGIADEQRAKTLIDSCDKMLSTPQGYRLLAPTFTHVDNKVGRISCMEPGICENGTIYTHCNIWLIYGLLKTGLHDKAYEAFKRITSGYYKDESDLKQKCPPYIYANCYYGPDHKNNAFQMEFSWITGSISWVNQVMASAFLGVQADYNGLRIFPRVPTEWGGYTYSRKYRNATYDITVNKQKGLPYKEISITFDGNPLEGNLIPYTVGKNHHKIIVNLL